MGKGLTRGMTRKYSIDVMGAIAGIFLQLMIGGTKG